MLAHHRGLGITAERRHRCASTVRLTPTTPHLPDDPEFRAAILGYARVGHPPAQARLAPRPDDVAQRAPVAPWGTGVAPAVP